MQWAYTFFRMAGTSGNWIHYLASVSAMHYQLSYRTTILAPTLLKQYNYETKPCYGQCTKKLISRTELSVM